MDDCWLLGYMLVRRRFEAGRHGPNSNCAMYGGGGEARLSLRWSNDVGLGATASVTRPGTIGVAGKEVVAEVNRVQMWKRPSRI